MSGFCPVNFTVFPVSPVNEGFTTSFRIVTVLLAADRPGFLHTGVFALDVPARVLGRGSRPLAVLGDCGTAPNWMIGLGVLVAHPWAIGFCPALAIDFYDASHHGPGPRPWPTKRDPPSAGFRPG